MAQPETSVPMPIILLDDHLYPPRLRRSQRRFPIQTAGKESHYSCLAGTPRDLNPIPLLHPPPLAVTGRSVDWLYVGFSPR